MLDAARRLARTPIAGQFARFLVVGAGATLVHYGVLISLVELGGLSPVLATTCGYCCGIVFSYVFNRRYTFKSDAPVAGTFAKFVLISLVGMSLNAAIVAFLTAQGLLYLIAQIVATGLVLIWNFLSARFLAFR